MGVVDEYRAKNMHKHCRRRIKMVLELNVVEKAALWQKGIFLTADGSLLINHAAFGNMKGEGMWVVRERGNISTFGVEISVCQRSKD